MPSPASSRWRSSRRRSAGPPSVRSPLRAVGLGSNTLAADEGIDALVLKLGGELAGVEASTAARRGRRRTARWSAFTALGARSWAGSSSPAPSRARRAARVWMNAGAYGSDICSVLERALVVDGAGARWRRKDELGLAYRRSGLQAGQVVARVELRLQPRPADEIRAVVADMHARRKAAQPTNKRTFGSVFRTRPTSSPRAACSRPAG